MHYRANVARFLEGFGTSTRLFWDTDTPLLRLAASCSWGFVAVTKESHGRIIGSVLCHVGGLLQRPSVLSRAACP